MSQVFFSLFFKRLFIVLFSSACGQCNFCHDSPQFGGPGVKKQSCLERRCHRVLENKLQVSFFVFFFKFSNFSATLHHFVLVEAAANAKTAVFQIAMLVWFVSTANISTTVTFLERCVLENVAIMQFCWTIRLECDQLPQKSDRVKTTHTRHHRSQQQNDRVRQSQSFSEYNSRCRLSL